MLGPALLAALGARTRTDRATAAADARDLRTRAFTLFENAYDQCRRAVNYLRWNHGDVESYTPVLRPRVRSPRAGAATTTERAPEVTQDA